MSLQVYIVGLSIHDVLVVFIVKYSFTPVTRNIKKWLDIPVNMSFLEVRQLYDHQGQWELVFLDQKSCLKKLGKIRLFENIIL